MKKRALSCTIGKKTVWERMVAQMTYVAPSLLAADFSALGAELKKVREAEILHIDIMDGNFVPNLTMGPRW